MNIENIGIQQYDEDEKMWRYWNKTIPLSDKSKKEIREEIEYYRREYPDTKFRLIIEEITTRIIVVEE